MPVSLKHRYGSTEELSEPARYVEKIHLLVGELCDEQFPRPDYEHQYVSVRHETGWLIDASMEGDVVLARLGEPYESYRFLFGLSRQELEGLMVALAEGRLDEVFNREWSDTELKVQRPGRHFLFRSCLDMTDLQRATTDGDCEWIRSELAAGAAVDAQDRYGMTALHWAVLAGQIEACALLVAAGANPLVKVQSGETAVDYAESADEFVDTEGQQEIIRVLREACESRGFKY